MNVKTFHKLMLPIPFVMVIAIPCWVIPSNPFSGLCAIPILLMIVYGIIGGIGGVLLLFGKFYLGCPFCGTRSKVMSIGPSRSEMAKGMILRCPKCGDILATNGKGFSLRCKKLADV